MKIGVFGTGDVGTTLASGFLATGHQVLVGSRQAGNEKAVAWAKKSGPGAGEGSFQDAAKFGELLVFAVSWSGAQSAIELAGIEHFAGKVLIDATNPLIFGGRGPELQMGHTDSVGEQVQRWLPEARVVKAFNTVGYRLFFKPELTGGPPDMFFCGNDDGAKKTVADILTSFGWSYVDVGNIEGARWLEPMCLLWLSYGMRTQSTGHAFKLLRK